jgi:queuine tRNA-ribosyltransferase
VAHVTSLQEGSQLFDQFRVLKSGISDAARLGELQTIHGRISTPTFMSVATQATVKAITPHDLIDLGAEIILSNTYHLYLRPGIDVVETLGGLHQFMRWPRPILTDSGGYQVFSLSRLRRVEESGVFFRSHLDGSQHYLTPENVVRYQERIGSDIMMVLDECPSHDAGREEMMGAMGRTSRWAERCLSTWRNRAQHLFGIVQGGTERELRKRSVEEIAAMDFPGYAIGGLSLGEPSSLMHETAAFTASLLPRDRPRYLMGVGAPDDLVECVAAGIDLFDCALPTRVARNGALFTPEGRVNLRNQRFRQMDKPLDPGCDCYTCHHFSAAYLHHLFRCEELLVYRLATIHNLRYIHRLMEQMRAAIESQEFGAFRKRFFERYQKTNEEKRLNQKSKWLTDPHPGNQRTNTEVDMNTA